MPTTRTGPRPFHARASRLDTVKEPQTMPNSTRIATALILMAALSDSLSTSTTRAAEIEAGAAAVEITPPKGYRMAGYYAERLNTGTHDPLYAKALVFRQGDRQAAFVFCDLVGIPREVASRARERAATASGIPVANIAVAATHSHTGPLYFGILRAHFHDKAVAASGRDPHEEFDFPAHLVERIVEVVVEAQKKLVPVRLETGIAEERRLAFNRRYRMKDGSVRFNPGVNNPDIVRPAGPIDPEVGILLIEPLREDRPIAGLTVFALHLDTIGGTEYAADYPYYLETALKQAYGPEFLSVFGAGTCGDINHINVKRRERAGAEKIGEQLAETVLGARSKLSPVTDPALDVRSTLVTCDVQRPDARAIDDARAKADRIATGTLPFLEAVQAAKVLDLLRHYSEDQRLMEVQAFRLGPKLAIVTLPGEVFVELGLAIKSRSPFETTLVVELANDVPSYIPTEKAFREGSYEVVNSRLAPGSGEQLVAAAVRLLKELNRSSR
jgi:neutral ceramidase